MFKRSLQAIFMQVGVFVFLETFLFRPIVFTADNSGLVPLLSALSSTLIVITLMLVWAGVLSLIERRAAGRGVWLAVWGALLLPAFAIAVLLLMFLGAPVLPNSVLLSTPLIVATLMGLSAIAQIFSFAYGNALDSYGLLLSTGAGVLLAALLTYVVFLFIDAEPIGLVVICAVMLGSGVLLKHLDHSRATEGDRQAEPVDERSQKVNAGTLPPLGLRDTVLVALPIALELIFCAASPGLAWSGQDTGYLNAESPMFIALLPLGVVFLALLIRLWKRILDIDAILLASTVPLAIMLLLYLLSSSFEHDFLMALGFLVQMLFLILGWICALLLGRMGSRTGAIALSYIVALLALYGCFIVISQYLHPMLFSMVLVLLSLAFVFYLVAFFFRKSRNSTQVVSPFFADHDDFNAVLHRRCEQVCQQFKLSEREYEVLPLLTMGLSANSIAKRLFISPTSVNTYRYRIYGKLDIHSHEELLDCVEQIGQ
jgi:DNA-binding CsgD family transcriptional regulator